MHVRRFLFLHQFVSLLRFDYLLKLRVGDKRFPVLVRFLPAGISEDIDGKVDMPVILPPKEPLCLENSELGPEPFQTKEDGRFPPVFQSQESRRLRAS
jgi:hypothetical protein